MTKTRNTVPTRSTNNTDKISVIIMGANVGYRMKSYGPQSLFRVDGKTLIQRQVDILQKKIPGCDIVLVTGYYADKVIKNRPDCVRIVENVLYTETNEVEQLRLAFNNILTESALIISADMVFDFNTIKPLTFDRSSMIVESQNMISKENIGVTVVNGEVTIMNYCLGTKWCHMTYLTGKEFKIIKQLCTDKNRARMYFSEVLNVMLERQTIPAVTPQAFVVSKLDSSELIL